VALSKRDYSAAIDVEGLSEYRKALRALERGANRDLTKGLKDASRPILATAKATAPRSAITRPGYRHIGDTLKLSVRGNNLAITSNKPGARVIHWGGRHPLFGNRDRWYPQRAQPFIARAIDRNRDTVVDAIGDAIDEHARRLGWR